MIRRVWEITIELRSQPTTSQETPFDGFTVLALNFDEANAKARLELDRNNGDKATENREIIRSIVPVGKVDVE
jgi:hypothetical protein